MRIEVTVEGKRQTDIPTIESYLSSVHPNKLSKVSMTWRHGKFAKKNDIITEITKKKKQPITLMTNEDNFMSDVVWSNYLRDYSHRLNNVFDQEVEGQRLIYEHENKSIE